MYKLFMALRYLRAHKIIYFSIAGVAVGITAMIIVTSVMGGFSRDIRARIRGLQSHIVVRTVSPDMWILGYEEMAAKIRDLPHITGCAPRLEWMAWMTSGGRTRDVKVIGIDPAQEAGTGDLRRYFEREGTDFSSDAFADTGDDVPGMVIGAENRIAWKGDEVVLQTARRGDIPMGLEHRFRVTGWFRTGMAEYDSELVFIGLRGFQDLLRLRQPPRVNVLAVGVDDYERHGAAVWQAVIDTIHSIRPCSHPRLHARGQCRATLVLTWEEERSILLKAVSAEKGIQIIILFCIVIVAAFNIIAIYTLMAQAKTRDVGILRSLGGTRGGVIAIFLLSGAFCGLVGSLVGMAGGLLISQNLNELVDFVRISSRELNRLSFVETGEDRSAVVGSVVLYGAALAALMWSWILLYRPWKKFALIPSLAAGLLLAAAAWVFFSWTPEYGPRAKYDWESAARLRVWIVVLSGSAPMLWSAVRRLAEPLYESFIGSALRVAATLLYSALAMVGIAGLSVGAALALGRPKPGFLGYDLFPADIYYLDRVPVLVDGTSIAVFVLATLVVCVAFSIYPALRAAHADPIEAIRDE
ncbi:MAG: ABC transporter permease [Planctomycetes bacterium]|nr:ABC transporter permease [Planctomycetota bacterium]